MMERYTPAHVRLSLQTGAVFMLYSCITIML